MAGSRQKGQPDREIYNLFAALNQEQQREKHDIHGIYEGRLRSHAQNFEGVKRKWEGFTGVPVPKKLWTSEANAEAPRKKDNVLPNQPSEAEPNQKPTAKTVKRAKAAAPAKKAALATATMPPHPDDNISVSNMLVKHLQKELKKRGLGTAGRKAELQARLKGHLAEARKKREVEWAAKFAVAEKKEDRIKQVKIGNDDGKSASLKENAKEVDVVMEDANGADARMSVEPEKVGPVKKALASMRANEGATKSAKKSATATVGAMKNNLMRNQAPTKSALKPSKYASTFVQSAAQLGGVKPAAMPAPASLAKEVHQAPKQLVPTKVSESSSESSYAAVPKPSTASDTTQPHGSKAAKISSTLAQTEPGGSALKPKSASAKLLEKKKAHAAANEARKARMAEMRQKSAAVSSTKPPPSHSKYAASSTLKKMATGSTLGETKPNNILAKMREKAAAEKNTVNAAAATNSTEPVEHSGSSTFSSSLSTVKRGSQVVTSKPAPNPTALKSILDPANRPAVVPEVAPKPSPPKEKPLSPMQTYEMSDREEDSSDSESESDEEYERQRPKKAIPEWAQRSNLHRALERQFMDGPSRLDPDKIFGEVVTCNLEEIFDMKKAKYKRRTSSGNWTKDQVRLSEKLSYSRTMGYN